MLMGNLFLTSASLKGYSLMLGRPLKRLDWRRKFCSVKETIRFGWIREVHVEVDFSCEPFV
jgi:hypothetical protein